MKSLHLKRPCMLYCSFQGVVICSPHGPLIFIVFTFAGTDCSITVRIPVCFFYSKSFNIFSANGTNVWQYTIPDGGQEEIQCMPNNANASIIRWEVFGKILGQPMNSSNAEGLSNFNISRNSSLIVTNPRKGSLRGLVNVTCIARRNNTNDSRIIYRIAFLKGNKNRLHFVSQNTI